VQADGETTYAIEFFYDVDGTLIRAVESKRKQPEKNKDHEFFFTPDSVHADLEETPVNAAIALSEEQLAQENIVETKRPLVQNLRANTDNPSVGLVMTPLWSVTSGLFGTAELTVNALQCIEI
jgi:hypothetical protein